MASKAGSIPCLRSVSLVTGPMLPATQKNKVRQGKGRTGKGRERRVNTRKKRKEAVSSVSVMFIDGRRQ